MLVQNSKGIHFKLRVKTSEYGSAFPGAFIRYDMPLEEFIDQFNEALKYCTWVNTEKRLKKPTVKEEPELKGF